MIRTYPLHGEPARRPDSLRDIFRRLEREIAEHPRPARTPAPIVRRSGLPF